MVRPISVITYYYYIKSLGYFVARPINVITCYYYVKSLGYTL